MVVAVDAAQSPKTPPVRVVGVLADAYVVVAAQNAADGRPKVAAAVVVVPSVVDVAPVAVAAVARVVPLKVVADAVVRAKPWVDSLASFRQNIRMR